MSQDKRQRQRENRQKRIAAERKQARAKALRRRITQVVALFVIVVVVLGINTLLRGGDDTATTDTSSVEDTTQTTITVETTAPAAETAVPAGYEDYRALPVACGGSLPPEAIPMTFDAPEDQGINPTDTVIATMVTSCGDIVLELEPAAAPETVNSFVFLARQGYYDGTAFHRIIEGFMAQGGDPTAVGNIGPGYTLPDELPEEGFVYTKGTLAMANSTLPNSSGSQFFVVFGDSGLPPTYSVFGQAADSDETLAAIEVIPKEFRGTELSVPMEGLWIERVDIEITPGN